MLIIDSMNMRRFMFFWFEEHFYHNSIKANYLWHNILFCCKVSTFFLFSKEIGYIFLHVQDYNMSIESILQQWMQGGCRRFFVPFIIYTNSKSNIVN